MIQIKTIITIFIIAVFIVGGKGSVFAFKGMGANGSEGQQESMTSMVATQHSGNQDLVVARVNGTEITMGPLMSIIMDVKMQNYGGKEVTNEIARRIRHEALEQLAIEELAYQRSEAIGITISPDAINAQIEALKKNAGGDEAFQKNLSQKNKSIDDVTNELHRFMAVKKTIEKEVDSQITITPEEIDEIYQITKEQYVTPERVVISDVVFFLDPDKGESLQQVNLIREKIIKELDNAPERLSPEGFIVKSGMNLSKENTPDLYKVAMTMKTGDLSPPLIINGTLHLIKLEGYQPRVEKTEEKSKAIIRKKLKSFKKKEALADWRQKLLNNAKIEIVHELFQ